MSRRGRCDVLSHVLLAAVVLGLIGGCEKAPEEPVTHDEIAGVAALQADADELKGTLVTPHMAVPLDGDTNVLWCATFQLAWNELADLLGGKLTRHQGPSAMVPLLNRRSVTKDVLDEASYVALAGYPKGGRKDIFKRIDRALEQKFGGAACPTLLPRDRLGATDPVAYAYLFKSPPFEWRFGRSRIQGLSFEGDQVQTFGIDSLFWKEEGPSPKAMSQVLVMDYRNGNDFVIRLATRSYVDQIVLAKVPAEATLEQTVRAVRARLTPAADRPRIKIKSVQVPVLDFDLGKDYRQLLSPGFALQQIRFKLDESGAVLKSEAVSGDFVARRGREPEPVDLIFDTNFLILLQRREATAPYLALWVANAELLVPVKKGP